MSGGVFISYRREDSAGFAGRIYDRLTRRLDPQSIFLDVDSIRPGLDFFDVLSKKLNVCDALIAVIGKNWLASADKDNRRRLDDPDDLVRIEIEAALQRDVQVIPVLVDGAAMPQAEDLPDSLKKLARRQALEVSYSRFDSDVERLISALAQIGNEARQPEDQRLAGRGNRASHTTRGASAPIPAQARSKVAPVAFAAAAVLIFLAFGAWFLSRGPAPESTPVVGGVADSGPRKQPRPPAQPIPTQPQQISGPSVPKEAENQSKKPVRASPDATPAADARTNEGRPIGQQPAPPSAGSPPTSSADTGSAPATQTAGSNAPPDAIGPKRASEPGDASPRPGLTAPGNKTVAPASNDLLAGMLALILSDDRETTGTKVRVMHDAEVKASDDVDAKPLGTVAAGDMVTTLPSDKPGWRKVQIANGVGYVIEPAFR
jgi:TIR domain